MLLVPYLAGLITTGFSWPVLPLLVAWTAGYVLSYFALLAVKTRRPGRIRPQLAVYGAVTLAAGMTVLAARPRLLAFAPVFALVLAANAFFAAHRNDRALANGLVSALAGTLIVPVVAAVNGVPLQRTAGTFLIMLLYFAGTVFFVKTCIRERGNRALLTASAVFHLAALGAAVWVAPLYAVPFTWYLVRAVVLPRRTATAKQLGFVEIGGSLLLLAVVAAVT
ncbi:YwiC-like family protein [Planomonospora sp. ID82291]|nr:YwiC-like family protein [Planomonospora sp. ID82291]